MKTLTYQPALFDDNLSIGAIARQVAKRTGESPSKILELGFDLLCSATLTSTEDLPDDEFAALLAEKTIIFFIGTCLICNYKDEEPCKAHEIYQNCSNCGCSEMEWIQFDEV